MSRKYPKQERSRQLVGDILFAGFQLFERVQFDSVSTNKVAEFAGVSIGSFYRYFSNKKTFFSQIIDLRLEANRRKLQEILRGCPETDFESYVRFVVSEFTKSLLMQKGYLRALIALQFELSKSQKIIDSRWAMAKILADEFGERFEFLRQRENLQKKFFYLINAGFGLVYLYSQTDKLPMQLNEFQDEMALNAFHYLKN